MHDLELRPLAEALPDGRIAVYIGAAYSYLPRDKARVLLSQVAQALGDDAAPVPADGAPQP